MELYNFQKLAVNKLSTLSCSMLCFDMGLGKTFTSFAIWLKWMLEKEERTVIVCPKAVKGTWKKIFDEYKIPICDNSPLTQVDIRCSTFVLVSYETFKARDWKGFKYFIFDECQKAKSAKTKAGKAMFKATLQATHSILLSGNPQPQGYIDSLNYFKCLTGDPRSDTELRKQFTFNSTPYKPYPTYDTLPRYEEMMNELYSRLSVWLKTDKVAEIDKLPEQTYLDIKFEESDEFQEFFDNQCYGDYFPKNGGAWFAKLRELASGFLNDTNGDGLDLIKNKWTDKQAYLEEMISSTTENIVVFYNFESELQQIVAVTKKTKIKSYRINGMRNELKEFLNSRTQSLIACQYQAASMGIDGLQDLTSLIVCYSPTLSANLWSQMLKRIHRIGQKKLCRYYLFQNEFEAEIYKNLRSKESLTEYVFEQQYIKTHWKEKENDKSL